jgi:cell division protein FtsB
MKPKKQLRTNLVIRAAFAFIFIFLFVSVINLQVEMNDLRKERDTRIQQVQRVQDNVDELKLRIKTPVDDEFIERIAREHGYRKPNELIFVNDIAN